MSISFKLQQRSAYRDSFRNVFGPDVPFTTGFELSNTAIDPEPSPDLNVILVTGATITIAQRVCERFAQDFEFCYIDVHAYLQCLAEKPEEEARKALGSLHPLSLKRMLEEKGKFVPAFFLLEILRRKIDAEVDRSGQTKFLISGMDEDAETAMRFAEKIVQPAALFSFTPSHSIMKHEEHDQLSKSMQLSDVRAAIEEHYVDIRLQIGIADNEAVEAGYGRLFAVISKKACAASEARSIG